MYHFDMIDMEGNELRVSLTDAEYWAIGPDKINDYLEDVVYNQSADKSTPTILDEDVTDAGS